MGYPNPELPTELVCHEIKKRHLGQSCAPGAATILSSGEEDYCSLPPGKKSSPIMGLFSFVPAGTESESAISGHETQHKVQVVLLSPAVLPSSAFPCHATLPHPRTHPPCTNYLSAAHWYGQLLGSGMQTQHMSWPSTVSCWDSSGSGAMVHNTFATVCTSS